MAKAGGHITTVRRKALPKAEFALPPTPDEKKAGIAGSYPIDTPARARNALARVAQNGTPAEIAAVKRKVKAKYPSIDVGGK